MVCPATNFPRVAPLEICDGGTHIFQGRIRPMGDADTQLNLLRDVTFPVPILPHLKHKQTLPDPWNDG